MFWKRRKPSAQAGVALTDRDLLPLEACYEGLAFFGQTGSGKTTGLARRVARMLLREKAGLLVLCAKTDEFANWERLCQQEGRAGDLVRFGPGSGQCFDFLGFELEQPGATAVSAAQLLDTIVEVATGQKSEASGDNAFFVLGAQRGMRAAIETVRLASGTASVKEVYRCLMSAARSVAEYESADWAANSFCGQCLARAVDRGATPEQLEMIDLWWREYAELHEKTRSSIHMNAASVLAQFLTGDIAPLVSAGRSTVTPIDIQNGAIVVVDCPVLRFREPGRFVNLVWKLATQRQVLRSPNGRPVCVWADECQYFVTPEADVLAQTVARQAKLISVALTQNLSVLYDQFGGGDKARQQCNGWLANHATKVLGTNSDKEANDFFSALLGMSMQPIYSGSYSGRDYNPVDDWLGHLPKVQMSVSEQLRPNVLPGEFALLQAGGPPDFTTEVIVYRGGRTFSNGKHYLRVRVKQDF